MLILSFLYAGCSNVEKSKKEVNLKLEDSIAKLQLRQENSIKDAMTGLDSVKALIRNQYSIDTTGYTFILEGDFSAEGNEGKAFYKENKIDKIEITFYGETGKSYYVYKFMNKMVNVSQQRFNYRTNFTEVKSGNDIIKAEQHNFTTDLNGKLSKGGHPDADLATFHELKKVVPFDLN
ncbi:hypothetical protein E5L68_010750 [Pedobacter helvus]|uniref:Lipoprotein n=2 Tax=Pedobacter helvus TaxID=2563444 RepID=A0ABW9JHJ3_9SPHI